MGVFYDSLIMQALFLMFISASLLWTSSESASSEARVETLPGFNGTLPFEMYTGYITMNESTQNNMFYYFVKSERNASEDPVLLWLTGGPACTSLSGLLLEVGPLRFNVDFYNGSVPTLYYNPYAWTKISSIIFLDSPTGAGFSYSDSAEDYETGDFKTAKDAKEFIRKWLLFHPDFLSNPLYITGDSYSGMIIPVVTYGIFKDNENGVLPYLNLKGYTEGNPLTHYVIDKSAAVTFAHSMALISDEIYEAANVSCKGDFYDLIDDECTTLVDEIDTLVANINDMMVLEFYCSEFWRPRPKLNPRRRKRRSALLLEKRALMESQAQQEEEVFTAKLQLPSTTTTTTTTTTIRSGLSESPPPIECRVYTSYLMYIWINYEGVQEALHIRNGTLDAQWTRCNETLRVSFEHQLNTTVNYHRALLTSGIPALVYSGDHDMSIPHIGTQAWIKMLNFSIVSDWNPWFVGDQVGGYTRKFEHNLTYVTVKGAGHTAPEYMPKECFYMFYRWISGLSV